jgi:hypothetical protein
MFALEKIGKSNGSGNLPEQATHVTTRASGPRYQ